MTLALALSANAIESKHVVNKVQDWSRDEKKLFDWWLIRLGLDGKEFKNVREHLTKNLPSAAALAA